MSYLAGLQPQRMLLRYAGPHANRPSSRILANVARAHRSPSYLPRRQFQTSTQGVTSPPALHHSHCPNINIQLTQPTSSPNPIPSPALHNPTPPLPPRPHKHLAPQRPNIHNARNLHRPLNPTHAIPMARPPHSPAHRRRNSLPRRLHPAR